jgi:leucyl-tRNA synthetase
MNREIDFFKIERKWQERWEKARVFEPVVKKEKKFFLTFPYPYVNLSPHIGHFYTLMRVEAFARYKRARGFNVLFPQAWHATGSPIVAAAERVKEKETKIIKQLKKEGLSDKDIKNFEDPKYWIKVFSKKWEEDLKAMGLSIDWRRNFYTTSLNPYYDRFIKWQFRKLKEKNLIEKGKHPVVWDPKTNMPVGDHDRVRGEGETPQEFCLFKFELEDGRKIITATLRPDTSLGITNVYVNPDIEYIEVKVGDELWVVAEPIVKKLKNQEFNVKIKGKVKGERLIGKKAEFFQNQKIPILPASFLKEDYGTGIVHSVPSESADDLIALKNLQGDGELIKKYNLNPEEIKNIEPIEIFETPGIKGISAEYFLSKYNVKSQNERSKLEKIKKELYKLTFSKSKLNKLYKKGFSRDLSGMLVSKAQDIIKQDLLKQGKIELFYELTGEVISRSLTPCVVKIVSDQWFIRYSDLNWKKKAHEALKQVNLYPEAVREQFDYVIDWLNDWACTREYGLGMKLPFDEKWLIESLSDSTIYMAYYTIAHLTNQ